MDIIKRIDRTINSNQNCIQALLDAYATRPMRPTPYTVSWDEALMAIQKLQEANNELVILKAGVAVDRNVYADGKP